MKRTLINAVLIGSLMIIGSLSSIANAGLIFYIYESGNNVVIEGSGSVDTTNFPLVFTQTEKGFFNGTQSVGVGNSNNTSYFRVSVTGDGNFGNAGWPGHGNLHTGMFFGFDSDRYFYLPAGYVSNSFISGTTTYLNRTMASLGLITGDYSYLASSSGTTITNTVDIFVGRAPTPAAPVSEPSTLLISAFGLFALAFRRVRKHNK